MTEMTPEELRENFWKKDINGGGCVYYQYIDIKRVLEEKDWQWVEKQYQMIKKHAIEQTEYYRNYMVDDEFPVVNKSVLMENKQAFSAKAGFRRPIHISSTSGSTGTPFAVEQDYGKRKRNIADLKVFGELCDYPSHERMVFFRVFNEKLNRTPQQEMEENIFYVDSSDLGDEHLEEMRQIIHDKKPRIIFSYASTLVELAKYIRRMGKDDDYTMKSVLVGGEGIAKEDRLLLCSVFGCKVYRRYSDMELGILGQDCGDGGSYILNWGSYFFECLKMDSDEPADPDEVGRIVITDLFNYAFPMIRYDTGDLGIMEQDEAGGFPRLREIYGRMRDCVYTVDGRLISPAKISVMMWGSIEDGVRQWQFIQEGKSLYVLKLNCSKMISTDVYVQKFKTLMGEDAQIQVELVDEIPVTSSNKRRAVICNYQNRR